MSKETYRNFTAILPVTCNANCVFCPEKEMEKKASKDSWLNGLVNSLFANRKKIDHVSLSGGEPTLNVKLLQQTIDTILSETHITRIGLTSNGQFLESANKTLNLLNALTDNTTLECKLDFMNISMHSFDSDLNMEIMSITSMFDLDALVRFRKMLGRDVSFHINFVVCKQNIRNIKWEMQQARQFITDNPNFDIVFRVDYALKDQFEKLHDWAKMSPRNRTVHGMPRLVSIFNKVFNNCIELKGELKAEQLIGYCPSCFTLASYLTDFNTVYLKASAYEPNEILDKPTELIYHMDGNLYYDWSRKQHALDIEQVRPTRTSQDVVKTIRKVRTAKIVKNESGRDGSCGYSGGCSY